LKNPRKSGKGLKDLEIFLRKWEEVFGAGGVGGRRPQKQDVQTHYTVKNVIKSDFGIYIMTQFLSPCQAI
jgi:hypothetical protein